MDLKKIIISKTWQGIAVRALCVVVFLIAILYPNFEPIYVQGNSMEPTFDNGQICILYTTAYRYNEPCIGDVVILKDREYPGGRYIKRLIAGPGDYIKINNEGIFVNGVKLSLEYGAPSHQSSFIDETVPPYHFFYIGDNRLLSTFGSVHRDKIQGKIILYD